MCLIDPCSVPTLVVVGSPMELPKIQHPSREEVEMYHKKYIAEIRRIYVTYADSYYKYCKEQYGIEVAPPTSKDNEQAIAFLTDAPPLQVW